MGKQYQVKTSLAARRTVIGSIVCILGLLAILSMMALFLLSGLNRYGDLPYWSVLDYFDFSEQGVWGVLVQLFGDMGSEGVAFQALPSLFCAILVVATFLSLIVNTIVALIRGIAYFVKGGGKHIWGQVSYAFASYVSFIVLLTMITGSGQSDMIGLNAAAIAGLCVSCVLVVACVVVSAFEFRGAKVDENGTRFPAHVNVGRIVLSLLLLGASVAITVLAAGPTIQDDDARVAFFTLFEGIAGTFDDLFAGVLLGTIGTLGLVSGGISLGCKMLGNLRQPYKLYHGVTGLGDAITLLLFSVLHIIGVVLTAQAMQSSVSYVIPAVLVALSVSAIVFSGVLKKSFN